MSNEPINLEGSNVLVVDDNHVNLDVLNQILGNESYSISFATCGEQALKIATLDQPDLILLDIIMDGMDGFETCRRLKSVNATRNIPVIFVTGRTDTKYIVEGFEIGAVDYISKPVQEQEVLARVRTHLQKEALIKQRDELIDLLRSHNEDIERSYKLQHEKLMESTRLAMLGELVGETTHEITTPIGISVTSISHLKSSTDEICEKINNNDVTKNNLESYLQTVKDSTDIAQRNLEWAVKLVASLKQAAIDQYAGDEVEISVRSYLEDTIYNLSPKLKKTAVNVSIECDEALRVVTLPGAISHIIINLVNNSLVHGYGPEDKGNIVIATHKEGDQLFMRYSDDGLGISSSNLEHVFDKYFTSKRNEGGSGLGLHILHNVVTKTLGGTVICESTEGQGATFELLFPVN